MKKLAIFISVLLAGCASSHYNGPSFAQQSKICRADGHSMDTLPGCIEAQLDREATALGGRTKKLSTLPIQYLSMARHWDEASQATA